MTNPHVQTILSAIAGLRGTSGSDPQALSQGRPGVRLVSAAPSRSRLRRIPRELTDLDLPHLLLRLRERGRGGWRLVGDAGELDLGLGLLGGLRPLRLEPATTAAALAGPGPA